MHSFHFFLWTEATEHTSETSDVLQANKKDRRHRQSPETCFKITSSLVNPRGLTQARTGQLKSITGVSSTGGPGAEVFILLICGNNVVLTPTDLVLDTFRVNVKSYINTTTKSCENVDEIVGFTFKL